MVLATRIPLPLSSSATARSLRFEPGDLVMARLGHEDLPATIMYVGAVEGKEGTWIGVELEGPRGKNDGSVGGVRYFTCPKYHGAFVSPALVHFQQYENRSNRYFPPKHEDSASQSRSQSQSQSQSQRGSRSGSQTHTRDPSPSPSPSPLAPSPLSSQVTTTLTNGFHQHDGAEAKEEEEEPPVENHASSSQQRGSASSAERDLLKRVADLEAHLRETQRLWEASKSELSLASAESARLKSEAEKSKRLTAEETSEKKRLQEQLDETKTSLSRVEATLAKEQEEHRAAKAGSLDEAVLNAELMVLREQLETEHTERASLEKTLRQEIVQKEQIISENSRQLADIEGIFAQKTKELQSLNETLARELEEERSKEASPVVEDSKRMEAEFARQQQRLTMEYEERLAAVREELSTQEKEVERLKEFNTQIRQIMEQTLAKELEEFSTDLVALRTMAEELGRPEPEHDSASDCGGEAESY